MFGRALHGQPRVGSPQPQEKVPRPAGVRHSYTRNLYEQLSDHRHQHLKAFEEHIQKHVSACFLTEQHLYNLLGLGVRAVWKLFIKVTFHLRHPHSPPRSRILGSYFAPRLVAARRERLSDALSLRGRFRTAKQSLSLSIYIYIYIYTYTYTLTMTYVSLSLSIYIYTHVYTYVLYIYIYTTEAPALDVSRGHCRVGRRHQALGLRPSQTNLLLYYDIL